MTLNATELDLIARFLDDRLLDTEVAPLQTLLRDNAHARRMLRDLATVDAKLTALAAYVPETADILAMPRRDEFPTQRSRLSGWRPLSGLALGFMLGVVGSSVAWAYAVPQWLSGYHETIPLIREGFETSTAPASAGLPHQANLWSGDFCQVVSGEQSVVPAEGQHMLQMLRADYQGKPAPAGSYCADLFQLVDLRPYRSQVSSGAAILQFSAQFNSHSFPDHEAYAGSIAIHALTQDMVQQSGENRRAVLTQEALAMVRHSLKRLDRDPQTWQQARCELRLPVDTDFLLLHLGVQHIPRYQQAITFSGHYLDDVQLTLTLRP